MKRQEQWVLLELNGNWDGAVACIYAEISCSDTDARYIFASLRVSPIKFLYKKLWLENLI
jgi:hypothetical protein